MIKGIIFDLDGTLLNTIEDITNALNYALLRNGLKEVSTSDACYFVGSGVKNLILRAIKNDESKFESVYSDYSYFYSKNSRCKTRPYSGIIRMLKDLKKMGYKIACFSNKADSDTQEIIKYYFDGMFDFVLGKKEGYPIKPNPEALDLIYDAIGLCSDELIYVGDSDVDVALAKNANLKSILCLWGYRKKEELDGATFFAHDANDILKIIAKINGMFIDGAIILDKDCGITSQEELIVLKDILLKKGYYIDKIGHAGTLDPLATGLLVCLINGGCKLSSYLLSESKEYECKALLGLHTEELDITGKVTKTMPVNVKDIDIDEALNKFIGKTKQVPPLYSAIKKDGKKLYDYAREDKNVKIEARDIEIYRIKRTSNIENNEFSFSCFVSKGTYIRSLVRDIASLLGTCGVVKELRRTKTEHFTQNMAYTIDDIKNDNFEILPLRCLVSIKEYNLNTSEYRCVLNGMPLDINSNEESLSLIYEDRMIAIYDKDKNLYKARVVWNN